MSFAFQLPEGLTPSSLDTIPVLSSLTCRLQNSSSINSSSTTASPQLTTGTGLLAFKDIPPATDRLKHQQQKARKEIRQLPDVDRTIEEQEAEIRDLEDKIRQQKNMILELKRMGQITRKEMEQTKDTWLNSNSLTPGLDTQKSMLNSA